LNDFNIDHDFHGTLSGSTNIDNFIFEGVYQITGGINGGSGIDSIGGPQTVLNTWTISGLNSGTLSPTGATGVTNFTNIDNLVGGNTEDIFNIESDFDGALTGGGGINHFNFNGVYQISNDIHGGINIDDIQGPTGTNTVHWTMANTANDGSITINPSGANKITNFMSITTLTGRSTLDTLIGRTLGETWTINGLVDDNSGSLLNSAITFSHMETLASGGANNLFNINHDFAGSIIGNTGNETFDFGGVYAVTGGINGNNIISNGTNELIGPNGIDRVDWTMSDTSQAGVMTIDPLGANKITPFASIDILTARSTQDTLTGRPSGDTWTISGSDSGSLLTSNVTFTHMEALVTGGGTNLIHINTDFAGSLTGSSGNDTFDFGGAYQVTGGIHGGSGTDEILGYSGIDVVYWTMSDTANAGTMRIDPLGINKTTAFTGIDVLSARSTQDTLFGRPSGDTWTITSNDGGTLTTSAITFSHMEALICTGAGANTFNINHDFTGPITGDLGNDAFNFGGAYRVVGGLDGGAGTNSITGPSSAASTWNITGVRSGTLSPTGASGATTFSNIDNLTAGNSGDTFTITSDFTGSLTGGSGHDIFDFTGLYQVTGGIHGGTGTDEILGPSGINTIHWTMSDTANAGSMTIDPLGINKITNFTGIDIIAARSSQDTLIGRTSGDTWTISGSDSGSLATSSVTFSHMEALISGGGTNIFNIDHDFTGPITGNTGTDAFNINGLYQVTGGIHGSTGTDTLTGPSGTDIVHWTMSDIANAGTITIDPTGINKVTNFTGIDVVTGRSTLDTLTGRPSGDTWTITSSGGGTLTTSAMTFNHMEALVDGGANNTFNINHDFTGPITGGMGNDTYIFGGIYQVSGGINAVGGNNEIIGPNGTDTIYWRLHGDVYTGSVTMDPLGANKITNFNVIQTFTARSTNDTLYAPDTTNIWNITDNNQGTLAEGINICSFSSMENLIGGADNDTYILAADKGVNGTINGGLGTNTLNYSAYVNPVSVNIATGMATNLASYSNITNFIGGTGNNTITGPNVPSTWNIGNDSGTINSTITFSQFQNVTGGNHNDAFVLILGSHLSGDLNGGAGRNLLDYSNYNGPVIIDLQNGHCTGIDGHVTNIQDGSAEEGTLIGGPGDDTFYIKYQGTVDGRGGTNTIVATDHENYWTVTGPNAGNIVTTHGVITFINIQKLQGGGTKDTFVLTGHGLVQSITNHNGEDIIIGPNVDTTWEITGVNAGIIHATGSATPSTQYSLIESLTGGTANDSFVIHNGGEVTNTIDGGAGYNVLDYSQYGGPVFIDWANGTATGVHHFVNIDRGIYSVETFQRVNLGIMVGTLGDYMTLSKDYSKLWPYFLKVYHLCDENKHPWQCNENTIIVP
jgi:hypothetical protein